MPTPAKVAALLKSWRALKWENVLGDRILPVSRHRARVILDRTGQATTELPAALQRIPLDNGGRYMLVGALYHPFVVIDTAPEEPTP